MCVGVEIQLLRQTDVCCVTLLLVCFPSAALNELQTSVHEMLETRVVPEPKMGDAAIIGDDDEENEEGETKSRYWRTIQYDTIQCNTIQYNTIQYNAIKYNTIQYITIQYNTIQYK